MNKNIVVTGATHNIGCDSPMHRLSVVFLVRFGHGNADLSRAREVIMGRMLSPSARNAR